MIHIVTPTTTKEIANMTESTPKPDRTIEIWTTVAVTALPVGWKNFYTARDGSTFPVDCPAVLLQEHRSDELVYGAGVGKQQHKVQACDAPYDTRVVFACGDEFGHLEPALETGNYAGTAIPIRDLNEDLEEATP